MKAKHTSTLCRGCLHGVEHHPERGACTYGHTTVTGGCRCPAFNTPADKIPGEPASIVSVVPLVEELELFAHGQRIDAIKALRARVGCGLKEAMIALEEGLKTPAAIREADIREELNELKKPMQAALDAFCEGIVKLVLRGGVASAGAQSADAVRSRSRAPSKAHGADPAGKPPACDNPKATAETASSRSSRPAEISKSGEVPASRDVQSSTSAPPQGEAAAPLGPIPKGALAVLEAIASSKRPCSSAKIELLTGYKSTMRSQYLGELRQRGLIGVTQGHYFASETGLAICDVDSLDGNLLARLSEGARKMFDAIAAAGERGATDAMLELETGYKSTMRSQYRSQLVTFELAKAVGGRWHLTADGLEQIGGKWPTPKRGDKLLEHVRSKLSEGAAFVLDAIAFNPPCTVHEIGVATSYKSTMLSTYLKELKDRELVVKTEDGSYDLAPELKS